MAKNQFQDIVPPKKRSIRDIPIPEGRQSNIPRPERKPEPPRRAPASTPIEERRVPPPPPRPPSPGYPEFVEENQHHSRPGLWLIAFIALIAVFFGISYLFAGAEVKVTPLSLPISVNQSLTADQNSTTDSAVPYTVVTINRTASTTAPASGDANVSTKASGTIVVYNNYSSASQTLIATTRFQTPEGLVYRIDKDIVVPGQKTVNGQKTPGSIEAVVYADQPGVNYNVGLKDFTIPGFQGTSKYQGFYARSKTPLTGGFVGTVKKVSDTDLANAYSKLESDLQEQFQTEAKAEVPSNFVLFPDALIITYNKDANPTGSADGTTAVVTESGTAQVIAFDRDVISNVLLQSYPQVNPATSTINNLDNLKFSLTNPNALNQTGSSTTFSFNLSGNAEVIPQIDTEALKSRLVGSSRSGFQQVLADFPSIAKAEVVFKPFWRWSFPSKASKITITIENPQ